MKKIIIIAGLGSSLLLFRSDLIKSWQRIGYHVVAAAPSIEAKEPLSEAKVDYYSIPLSRTGINPLKDINLFISLVKLMITEKPDYIFLYTVKPVIYGSLAANFCPGIKAYAMVTGLGYVFIDASWKNMILQKLVVMLYRLALKKNRKVFFQNPDDIDLFIKLNVVEPDKAILINGSGVNLAYYEEASPTRDRLSFLLIARLIKEKGIYEFMEAARLVKSNYPQVCFKMIGWSFDDNPSAISREQVETWREEGVVEIIGQTDDIRPFMREASVYVLPSFREGTPRTVLEAMAMGRAIITTDVPGCRETVADGVNGFLVPVKDSKALAEAMERFIRDPALAAKMGIESRRIAEEKYDVHKVNRVINESMGLLSSRVST